MKFKETETLELKKSTSELKEGVISIAAILNKRGKGNEIAVFKNRLEIYNPGRFPDEYSPTDFIKGRERSVLRNPAIANALFLASDIERWGSGLKRIYDACHEAGVKVEFQPIKSGFLVIFHRPDNFHETAENKSSEKSSEKGREKGREKILRIIRGNSTVSALELSKRLGISSRAVEKQIDSLKKEGCLRRIGPDKGGYWEIMNKTGNK